MVKFFFNEMLQNQRVLVLVAPEIQNTILPFQNQRIKNHSNKQWLKRFLIWVIGLLPLQMPRVAQTSWCCQIFQSCSLAFPILVTPPQVIINYLFIFPRSFSLQLRSIFSSQGETFSETLESVIAPRAKRPRSSRPRSNKKGKQRTKTVGRFYPKTSVPKPETVAVQGPADLLATYLWPNRFLDRLKERFGAGFLVRILTLPYV